MIHVEYIVLDARFLLYIWTFYILVAESIISTRVWHQLKALCVPGNHTQLSRRASSPLAALHLLKGSGKNFKHNNENRIGWRRECIFLLGIRRWTRKSRDWKAGTTLGREMSDSKIQTSSKSRDGICVRIPGLKCYLFPNEGTMMESYTYQCLCHSPGHGNKVYALLSPFSTK